MTALGQAPGPPDAPGRSRSERQVLTQLQRHGPMAGAALARATGLSAQSASVITRTLEAEGLIRRGAPQRGRIGKPAVPFAIDPGGAHAFGLRIGRRSADLILCDFSGGVQGHLTARYDWPTPAAVTRFARHGLAQLIAVPGVERIAGIGVGAPYQMWNWLDGTDAPQADMAAWRDVAFADVFGAFTDLPVWVGNDASLAAQGEHAFGHGPPARDFAYFHVGAFVGGGVILDDRLYLGPRGNAGAMASLPVGGPPGPWRQLLEHASIAGLEARCGGRLGDWSDMGPTLTEWIGETAHYLARAAVTAVAILDVPLVVIDGTLPGPVRTRLVARVAAEVAKADLRGLAAPAVRAGTLGSMAGALGAGWMPIVARYLTD